MEIRIKQTGQVMYEGELRAYLLANNGPSYDRLTTEVMDAIGVDPVLEGPQAATVTPYQYSQRSGVEQIGGKWYTKYIAGPVFTPTPAATVAEQEAAYKAQRDAEQAASVRATRATKLAACDWTQVADSPVDKEVWAFYRQCLRDITASAGFPWEINWPVEPV
jgi:hypothetical protein